MCATSLCRAAEFGDGENSTTFSTQHPACAFATARRRRVQHQPQQWRRATPHLQQSRRDDAAAAARGAGGAGGRRGGELNLPRAATAASAEQVIAAMAAAPDDGDVQDGCNALAIQPRRHRDVQSNGWPLPRRAASRR